LAFININSDMPLTINASASNAAREGEATRWQLQYLPQPHTPEGGAAASKAEILELESGC
jgi:hypothetical protein